MNLCYVKQKMAAFWSQLAKSWLESAEIYREVEERKRHHSVFYPHSFSSRRNELGYK